MKNLNGSVLMILTCMIWGSNFSFTKLALSGSSIYQFNFFRFLIGAVLLSIVFKSHLKKINMKLIKDSIILSVFTYGGAFFSSMAITMISASETGMYVALEIPMIPFMAFLLLKEKISKQNIFAIFIAFLGILIINYDGSTFSFSLGAIMAILAAVCYSLHIVFTEKYVERDDAIALVLLQFVTISIVYFILALTNGEVVTISSIPKIAWIGILLAGILTNSVSYVTQSIAQQNISASKTGLISSTTPVFSILVAVIFLKEGIGPNQILGSVMIISSVILSNMHFEFHRKHIKHY